MPTDNPHLDAILQHLQLMNPEMINMAVLLHCDRGTKKLKSISPIIQAASVQELYNQLKDARNAIHAFLEDLVKKGLCEN